MKCERSKTLIDIAHRLGGDQGQGRPRPLVVYMQTRSSKDYIMSKVGNLVDGRISVSDQLPKSMQERRLNQVPQFKKFRKDLGKQKVKLVRDKLIVNGKVNYPQFDKNPVKPISAAIDTEDIEWVQSEEQTENKSIFWGLGTGITCIEDVQEALAKVLEDEENAHASHIVYAYKFEGDTGKFDGHADDGEIGASRILMEELNNSDANGLIVVLRHYGGRNLGPKRFRIYREHAQCLVKGLEEGVGEGGMVG